MDDDIKEQLPTTAPSLRRESTTVSDGDDVDTHTHRDDLVTESDKETFLSYTCGHKGRFSGKTWAHVMKSDYNYFKWTVQNTMGRDTKSFRVFVECLRPRDIEVVKKTERVIQGKGGGKGGGRGGVWVMGAPPITAESPSPGDFTATASISSPPNSPNSPNSTASAI
jgi:hypothetical protein